MRTFTEIEIPMCDCVALRLNSDGWQPHGANAMNQNVITALAYGDGVLRITLRCLLCRTVKTHCVPMTDTQETDKCKNWSLYRKCRISDQS